VHLAQHVGDPALKFPHRNTAFFLVVVWVTIFPPQALAAYLDPGTGSLIIQSVIAALAAAGFALRLYWGKIRGWFKRSETSVDSPVEPPSGDAV
jgi:hypothetical protein